MATASDMQAPHSGEENEGRRPHGVRTARRKTEVMNLLESAGFSRANPYYVVQQGKARPPRPRSIN